MLCPSFPIRHKTCSLTLSSASGGKSRLDARGSRTCFGTAAEHVPLGYEPFLLRRRERVVDQVVIGTHGSLKNWVSKRILPLAAIRILVFDEADQMLQVGLLLLARSRLCPARHRAD